MDLLVWFGMERCEIRKAIHIKKCKIGLEITKKDYLNYGKKRCKIGLLKTVLNWGQNLPDKKMRYWQKVLPEK